MDNDAGFGVVAVIIVAWTIFRVFKLSIEFGAKSKGVFYEVAGCLVSALAFVLGIVLKNEEPALSFYLLSGGIFAFGIFRVVSAAWVDEETKRRRLRIV